MRWLIRGVGLLVAIAVFAAGWWAGRAALAPPQDPLVDPGILSYTVTDGVVSRELSASATASWASVGTLISGSGGVVTSVDAPSGTAVPEGARLLTVNLRPVILAAGPIPVFRALSLNVTGADVAQLQGFLGRIGFPPERTDGRFDAGTASAVRSWQRAAGTPATGVVELGDLIFAPTLPARVRLTVAVGASVGPGGGLGEILASAPEFRVAVTQAQVSFIPPAAAINIQNDAETWSAVMTGLETAMDGSPILILSGVDGGPVCASSCDVVPFDVISSWPAVIVVVAPIEGPVVPVTAIRSGADGSTSIRTTDGQDLPVEVLGSSGGLAVVSGVESGAEIEVPSAND